MKGDVGGVFGLETEGYECTGRVVKMLNCARLYLDERHCCGIGVLWLFERSRGVSKNEGQEPRKVMCDA